MVFLVVIRAKSYFFSWDEAYTRELNNFETTNDLGEVWFGEDTADRSESFVYAILSPYLTRVQC